MEGPLYSFPRGSRAGFPSGEGFGERVPAHRRPQGGHGVHGKQDHRGPEEKNARFIRSHSAGLRESHVHDVIITKEAPNLLARLKQAMKHASFVHLHLHSQYSLARRGPSGSTNSSRPPGVQDARRGSDGPRETFTGPSSSIRRPSQYGVKPIIRLRKLYVAPGSRTDKEQGREEEIGPSSQPSS
jgi:hypothetical protein